ncbi:hypothetical protein LTR47_011219 [Exophiala xenobiotica]|nr:hypothetical protein LTR92_011084 [Exophiala xenobiotica]KAK5215525.1 hypothetical protein LTR72_011423 [Exophiala xenobiotica]KAK5220353.1 hypothetical protein LTR47_011219 [Exophiala xenobiotica]KAK5245324.1 hypothetical protein LTS06_009238 [Exophiala xenobiotica]KAK5260700.1 hypothetical protein LTR40_003653 [Exophiala xenobiotica]
MLEGQQPTLITGIQKLYKTITNVDGSAPLTPSLQDQKNPTVNDIVKQVGILIEIEDAAADLLEPCEERLNSNIEMEVSQKISRDPPLDADVHQQAHLPRAVEKNNIFRQQSVKVLVSYQTGSRLILTAYLQSQA